LPKAKLGDMEFNGGIPTSRKGLVSLKMSVEILENPKSQISAHNLKKW